MFTSFMVLGEFVTSPPTANGVDLSFAIWVGFLISDLVFSASVYIGVLERCLDQRLLGAAAASQRKKKISGNSTLQNAYWKMIICKPLVKTRLRILL